MNQGTVSRVPWGLVVMAALVAVTEAAIARQSNAVSNPQGLEWRYGAHAASCKTRQCEVLCLGDSLLKFGLAPQILERRLGAQAFNLALKAAPPPATFFQLRRAVEAGSRPRMLVVDFVPHLLDWEPQYCAQLLPEVMNLRDCADLGLAARDAHLFGRLALARLVPSVRDRLGLRGWVLGALQGTDPVALRKAAEYHRSWRADSQGQANPRFNQARDVGYNALYPVSWRCAPINEHYVRRFLRLAQAYKLPVFWVLPPFVPAAHARREQAGLEQQYTRFVRAMQADYPNVVVIDGRQSGFGSNLHFDPLHLNHDGAILFTASLAEVLARYAPGGGKLPRWVELPGPADRDSLIASSRGDRSPDEPLPRR